LIDEPYGSGLMSDHSYIGFQMAQARNAERLEIREILADIP
jgi:hypothetical protein